jgi:small subunit ribosomal protein S16
MLAIRMRRAGSKKRVFYRVVVTDSHAARDSNFVEIVGHYNPRTRPATVDIDREKVAAWQKKGARLSDTVRTLLARHTTNQGPIVADTSAASDTGAAGQ